MNRVVLVNFDPEGDSAQYDLVDGKVVLTVLPGCSPGQADIAQVKGVYDYATDKIAYPADGETFLRALMTQVPKHYYGFQESSPLVDGTGEVRTTHVGSYVKRRDVQ